MPRIDLVVVIYMCLQHMNYYGFTEGNFNLISNCTKVPLALPPKQQTSIRNINKFKGQSQWWKKEKIIIKLCAKSIHLSAFVLLVEVFEAVFMFLSLDYF